jgi:parvulin-like peptidyl-prolyl isomerase
MLSTALAVPIPTTLRAADDFFADEVLVRGEKLEIRRPELEKAYLQFKANATLRNQPIPADRREELEAMLLDRLVVTQLLLNRSSATDRETGRLQAEEFVANVIREAGSESSFNRQLIALGFTREGFEAQVRERATCEAVVERELHDKIKVSEPEIQEYYDSNQDTLQRPAMAQARHILFSTRDAQTQAEISDAAKADKRQLAESVLKRVRQGESFPDLVREYSDDTSSKERDGEYVFPKGQMAPEFEAAAFSLEPGKISDVVTTRFGYHIIKLIQIIPPEPIALDQIKEELQVKLKREKVQSTLLPEHLKNLKEAARLEYLNGARPPAEPTTPQANPEL